MKTIYRTDGCAFYYPSGGPSGLDVVLHDSSQAATRHLLTMLQCFIHVSLGSPPALPSAGMYVYANAIMGDYLVLAVTSQGATVYHVSQADLERLNLPIPPRSF